jgi:putative ABC transport system permease protein
MRLQEVRYAIRRLRRQPMFAACVLAVLALAIGANTAMFALVDAILLRPLPFAAPERLITFTIIRPGTDRYPLSLLDIEDFKTSNRTLDGIVTMFGWSANVTGGGEAERLTAMRVSPDYFELTGTPLGIGRPLQRDDEHRNVAVIGHGVWQRRFGGHADVVGKSIVLNGDAFTIVGVLRPDVVTAVRDAEIVVPYSPATDVRRGNRAQAFLRAIARMKPGVDIARATADLSTIATTLKDEHPDSHAMDRGLRVVSLHDDVSGRAAPMLRMLFGAVALVLLVACANIANLFLVRGTGHRREVAVRAALGASRARIVGQLFAETALLGIAGGAAGLLVARVLVQTLVTNGPPDLPRVAEIGIDLRIAVFTLAMSLATSLLVGLVPALHVSRGNVREALQQGERGAGGGNRLRATLVFAEIALTTLLLTMAALLARSFQRVEAVDPGFRPAGVLTVRLSLPRARYAGRAAIENFYNEVQPRLASIPGVQSVAAANVVPMNNYLATMVFYVDGSIVKDAPEAHYRMISPDYFRALGIPLHRGRAFSAADRSDSPPVAIVNERLAAQFFGGRDPVGKRMRLADDGKHPREVEVVGIVGNVKHFGLEREATIEIYVPMSQVPESTTIWLANNMYWVVHTDGQPLVLSNAVRREIAAVDPAVPASFVRSMEQWMGGTLAQRRFNLRLVEAFAVAALLLAMVGVYAVAAFAVAARTRELGIRLALGASRREVSGLVLRNALGPVLGALGVGGIAAVVAAPAVSGLLFGVTPRDLVSLAASITVLASAALVATWLPARRASRIDPIVALRID